MKFFKFFTMMVVASAMMALNTSCDSDDDELIISPEEPGEKIEEPDEEIEEPGETTDESDGSTANLELDEGPFVVDAVGDVLSHWTKGSLDIHFINTGRGESSFLVFPDGTTFIVDFAGCTYLSASDIAHSPQTPSKPNDAFSTAEVIVNYINQYTSEISRGHIDYALATHYHVDHMGTVETTMEKGGDGAFYLSSMCDVGEQLPFKHFFHRGDYLSPSSTLYGNMRSFITWTTSANGTVAEQFNVGSKDQISMSYNPGDYPDFCIQNLACSGCCWTGEGENSEMTMPETFSTSDETPAENNLSCAFWLSFGAFDYYSGGDNQYNNESLYSYMNSEAPIAAVIGEMDVNKANHHGTSSSNSTGFMEATRPTVWIANPWRTLHPNGDTVKRVLAANPSCALYATNFGSECTASESDFVATQGHIVVRVAPDASTYYVYVLEDSDFSYVIKDVKTYTCK